MYMLYLTDTFNIDTVIIMLVFPIKSGMTDWVELEKYMGEVLNDMNLNENGMQVQAKTVELNKIYGVHLMSHFKV